MKLIYYSSEKGNVGDELNGWLWNKLFPLFSEKHNDTAFLGIGSILFTNSHYFDEASACEKKIIFGSGARSVSEQISFDNSYEIFFVRGPLTKLILNRKDIDYITDSAYFLALTNEYEKFVSNEKQYEIGLIPYYKSVELADWEAICKKNNWKFINPQTKNVEQFLNDVSQCKKIVSEAMHGAIIADIFRIPWKRFRYKAHKFETEQVSEFKWRDWLLSVDITIDNSILLKDKRKEFLYKLLPSKFYQLKNEKKLAQRLKSVEEYDFCLSSDTQFELIIQKLKTKQHKLQQRLS